MGIINAVVEVLAMHIERNQVTNMNPNIKLLGLLPTSFSAPSAIRLCKFDCSIAIASINPPIRSMFTFDMYLLNFISI